MFQLPGYFGWEGKHKCGRCRCLLEPECCPNEIAQQPAVSFRSPPTGSVVPSVKSRGGNATAAAHQRQLTFDQQTETLSSLMKTSQIAESDHIRAVEVLDEQKERSQSWLEHLQTRQYTVATLNCELQNCNDANKMGDVPGTYEQLMVPNNVPVKSITRGFEKPILSCHPERGRTQEQFSAYSGPPTSC